MLGNRRTLQNQMAPRFKLIALTFVLALSLDIAAVPSIASLALFGMSLVGALAVVGIANLLRHFVFPNLPISAALPVACATIVFIWITLYHAGILPQGEFYDDGISNLLCFVPGVQLSWLAAPIERIFVPGVTNSRLAVAFIPGVIGALLGAIQWFLIGSLWQRQGPTMRGSNDAGASAIPISPQ